MIGDELLDESPVSFSKTLEILEEKKENEGLEFEQRLAYDFVQKFTQLSAEESKEMIDELLEIPKIRDHQAVILANNMPKTKEDIELIFAKERTTLREDTIEEILDIIDDYQN